MEVDATCQAQECLAEQGCNPDKLRFRTSLKSRRNNFNQSFYKRRVHQRSAISNMSDPLSVTTSILGLIEATAKVSSLIRTMNGASSLLQDVLSEVSDIRVSLGLLQSLVFRSEANIRSRASLLMIEHIIVVLTKSVMTFSELEKVIEQFKSLRVVNRVRLARKAPTISKLLLRLRFSRESLSFMLTILTWCVTRFYHKIIRDPDSRCQFFCRGSSSVRKNSKHSRAASFNEQSRNYQPISQHGNTWPGRYTISDYLYFSKLSRNR